MTWGFWRVPESRVRALGDPRGRDVLEVGCGAARWSIALLRKGARAVGLDLSPAHLAHARTASRRTGALVPLVRADAERLPFRSRAFDIVFADWGAMTFADPRRTVPEAYRVLRPGGRLVFTTSSPLRAMAQPRRTFGIRTRLLYGYYDLHRLDYPNEVNFVLPYSGWIELFRRTGFAIEALIESRPPPRARSRYLSRTEEAWARRWPMESLWHVRKPIERGVSARRGPSPRPRRSTVTRAGATS